MSSLATINSEPLGARPGPAPAVVIGIALILCSFWMFVWRGSLGGSFHFDDYSNIVDNERIRQLWPLNDFLRNNRPVGLYSFAINYHFSQVDAYAYLVTNLAIHIGNGFLLFTGCWLTGRLWWRVSYSEQDIPIQQTYRLLFLSALIATFWTLHPITTQAVTYIVQRYESLSSFGYLAAWVGLLIYLSGFRKSGCAFILAGSWIGLMSKEIFATAPVVLMLLDRLLTQESWLCIFRKRWLPYTLMVSPFLWFVPSVSRFLDPVRGGGAMGFGVKKLSSWEYLRTQAEVIWHYLLLVVWPKELCVDYDWKIQNNAAVYLTLGASLVAILLAGLYFYRGGISASATDQRLNFNFAFAGWLILTFFLILAPTSSIMPIADLAFEHRMYLASAVVLAGILLVATQMAGRLVVHSEHPLILKLAFACILLACISLLGWRTHLRNLDYRNGLYLWRSATQVAPNNPRAWYNLGQTYEKFGDKDAALRPLINAVGLSNENVPLFDVGLAGCLHHAGRLDDAITLYQRAITKQHHYPEAHNNLGAVYLDLNRLDDARRCFETSVEQDHPEAKYNLALVYLKQNQTQRAIPLFQEVIDKHPEFPVAVRQLAWILATAEDSQLRHVERAQELMQSHYDQYTTQSAYVLDIFGAIDAAKGNFTTAIESTQRALSLAQVRDKPNAAMIADLQQRIQQYQSGHPWIGGSQP